MAWVTSLTALSCHTAGSRQVKQLSPPLSTNRKDVSQLRHVMLRTHLFHNTCSQGI